MKNANDFPDLYDDLFDFSKAGYIMLDVSVPYLEDPSSLKSYEYVSDDPDKYWMKGLMKRWHVTVRGPLDPRVRQEHCMKVLDSVEDIPKILTLGSIEVFPSPYEEDDYGCVVILVDDKKLFDLNQQLALLPGVQTYIPYRPHITFGYFKTEYLNEVRDWLYWNMRNSVKSLGFDFGRMAE